MNVSIARGITRASMLCALALLLLCSAAATDTAPNIAPNTTEEMQNPEFWISQIDNPDKEILTPAQIKYLNGKNRGKSFETTDINGDPYSIKGIVDGKDVIGVQFLVEDPLKLTTFSGDSLRARLDRKRDYFEKRTFFDRRLLKFDTVMKNELLDMTDYDSIPDKISPRHGILVSNTQNRVMPTNLPGWGSASGWTDQFQSTAVDFGTPVAILHASKNKDWYYVRSEISFGWVPAENVAIGTVAAIDKAVSADNFIVAVTHKVPVFGDKECATLSAELFMGARLKLVRNSAEGYEVMVPHRDSDGTLKMARGWVKSDAGVNVGYQKFTQRNIINTMFSLLYRPYGWADMCDERDCCGTTRVVYKTFGINMPRWTTHQLHSANRVHAFQPKTSSEIKYGILDKCEPAITLIGHTGHIIMYLGKVNGSHYVIHQNGYSYKAEDGTKMDVRRVYVNDTELAGGSFVEHWTEISEFRP
jgi:hypothetical protein